MEALPLQLSNAIDRDLASLSPDKLREACFDLSKRYTQGLAIESPLHRQAYIAARLPATYGATRQVFRRIESFLPPIQSLLDLGTGVGSLAWAAKDAMPNLKQITLFEKDIELLRLGQHLAQNSLDPLQLTWCRDDVQDIEAFPPHDAVVLSYVLNELPLNIQLHTLARAYRATDKLLVLIEPGTPKGFSHLLKARQLLMKLGAQCIAPCPHNGPCPLAPHFNAGKDWCHFSVRIPRGKYHRLAKDADLPFEDEKYAYLVVSPQKPHSPKKRVIKAPIQKSGHVILDLCTDKGDLARTTVSKSKGETYKVAKDLNWGDEWEETKK